jgi:hypothetical protein
MDQGLERTIPREDTGLDSASIWARVLNWYVTLASLPVRPAPGSTANLVLSTLICNASLAELTKLTNILSFWLLLLYQLIYNISEKAGSALSISPIGNGNKDPYVGHFLLCFQTSLCYIYSFYVPLTLNILLLYPYIDPFFNNVQEVIKCDGDNLYNGRKAGQSSRRLGR